jgi:hypothetical protein
LFIFLLFVENKGEEQMSIIDEFSFSSSRTSSLDEVLSTPSVSALVDRNRDKLSSDKLNSFTEGVRVVANTNNGLLIPNDLPFAGTKGTVVKVRTAGGEVTSYGSGVFVQWDGRRDKIFCVPPSFLRVASMKVAGLDDFIVLSGPSLLSSAYMTGAESGDLVHKSTKDLWSVKISEDGTYDIERLFDDDGNPLKV